MKKTLTILLALVLLLSCLPVGAAAAGGNDTKRAIAVVFDNSGSMYLHMKGDQEQRKAWCRATYAMEAFAAMMEPKDEMWVYPMNPINVNGVDYSYEQPFKVTRSTSSDIRNIRTPQADDTHIESIQAAREGIHEKVKNADEYWLVVLTDGDLFWEGRGFAPDYGTEIEMTPAETKKALGEELSLCREKMNVLYLGMGAQTAIPEGVKDVPEFVYDYYITKDGAEVLSALSTMCNTIFDRYALPGMKPGATSITFDLPMSKLILFIQGKGISNVKLGGKSADEVKEMKYSELGADNYNTEDRKAKGTHQLVDTDLQGQLLTFSNVDADNYALSYDGTATSIDVYYEPDVDVKLELLDAAGNPVKVDGETELIYGTYYISYTLVDKNGNPVPENTTLLGETKYTVKYTLNGKEHTVNSTTGDRIKLEVKQGETLDGASVRVTYLDGIPKERTSAELKWPKWTFKAPEAGWLDAKMSGGAAEYKLSQISAGEAFKAEFIYDGAPLTDAQLKKGEKDHLKINIEGGNAGYTYEIKDNAVYVTLKAYDIQYETDCGKYQVHVSYTYYNDDNKATNQATATASFEIKDDSRQLHMLVSTPQTYYEISKISEGKPITLRFDYSGQELTQEELKALKITYEAEGLTLLEDRDSTPSAVHFRLDPANAPAEGKYRINFTVSGINEVGREQSCDGRVSIEVSALPLWLKILIPILIIAAIITIIVLILNQKVLPKKMVLQNIHFKVTGPAITKGGNAMVQSPGKKHSAVTITTPASVVAGAKQSFTLNLTAETNRVTPYNQKKYTIESVSVGRYVYEYSIKGIKYQRDKKNPSQFLGPGKKPFKPILAGPGTVIGVKAKTVEGYSVNYSCKLVNSK